MVAVAYRRWSFTRGSNCKASTGKLFLFWIGGRLWEVRYIFTSCHSLSLKMDLSKERPWESYEQTPLKQRLRKYFRFQKALDRQRLATQFWKKNCYQKSHRTQRREGHVPKIKKNNNEEEKKYFVTQYQWTIKETLIKKKRGIWWKTNHYFTKILKNPLLFSWERRITEKDMLVLAKILRYRCAACHPLQFFTKNILNIQKAQVGIFPCVN